MLLQRIGFPYRDINLARSYDWKILEDLKVRLCTLTEVWKKNPYIFDALIYSPDGCRAQPVWLCSQATRQTNRKIWTSCLRWNHTCTYGNHVQQNYNFGKLKPKIQGLFEPRFVEYDRKRIGLRPSACPDVTDEIIDQREHFVRYWLRDFFRPLNFFLLSLTDAGDDHIHATFIGYLEWWHNY